MSASRVARSIAVTLALYLIGAGIAAAQTPGQKAETKPRPEPTITLATKPTPAAAGETTLTVTAKDAAGKPITGADVLVEFVMPPMGGMAEMRNKIALKPSADPRLAAAGTYVGTGQIMMAGTWTVTVDVKVGARTVADKKLTITAK